MNTSDTGTNEAGDNPTRRNAAWYSLQLLARITFPVWFRARTQGLEHVPEQGGALLLINHQSFLDPLMVAVPLSRPIYFVARDSLFRVPIVGTILRKTYVIPINRRAASGSTIRKTIDRLNRGYLVGVFPEGSRGDGSGIQPLKPGFTALLRRCKVPVIPVSVVGSAAAMPREAIFPRPRRVYVHIGEPFSVDELHDYRRRAGGRRLMELVQRRLQECFDEATAWRQQAEGPIAAANGSPTKSPADARQATG